MKLFLVFFIGVLFTVETFCQPHINFILELNDELVTHAYDFVIKWSLAQEKDSISVGFTLGELQMSSSEYSMLKSLPENTLLEVDFKIGNFYLEPVRSFSFTLERKFFFTRYLYVRFYNGDVKDGKCGWEYDSPINSRRLPIRTKRFLWWHRYYDKCPPR